ncbi:hypothetical protein FACS189474_3040 [Bacteroidia bacterium]|nr:hypothetical protein FACS189474_3040 [Bacteroidia bacterium]
MGGVFCYDVRSSLDAEADYPLTVTGQKSLDKVTWVITETEAVQSAAATLSNTNAKLKFNEQSVVSGLAPAEITITAYIDLTLTNDTKGKTSVSKTIKFRNAPCCPGYTAENGAFTGLIPSMVSANQNVQQVLNAFTDATRSDLCISPDLGSGVSWNTANSAEWCNEKVHAIGGVWADRNTNWRLPNMGELANLQATKWTQDPRPAGAIYSQTYTPADGGVAVWLNSGDTGLTGEILLFHEYDFAECICVREPD